MTECIAGVGDAVAAGCTGLSNWFNWGLVHSQVLEH